jgi:hypothetical protein
MHTGFVFKLLIIGMEVTTPEDRNKQLYQTEKNLLGKQRAHTVAFVR